ncbi:polymorphic toxin-type HINT domain-containing protein [Dactylosporangium siamense]|uniref:Hint domain-containing protein n=1 Tax=Dactylosporangium siamense TaxID=685454 RepID=A0A919PYR9_9ACTN|nr:polymorphic toxin-type HINT domain-containing protein [Dactylosporangium siamense]GIG51128.1 hypothetical protein Dsi01nite_091690 [Dactylosporangium siamense]
MKVADRIRKLLGDLIDGVQTWLKESKLARLFAKSCKNSFAAGTLVLLADGTSKPIQTLAIGDWVIATDPDAGHTTPREITYLHVNTDEQFTDLTVAVDGRPAAVIHTTQEHPFYSVTDHTWTFAGDLSPGEQLYTADGTTVRVLDRTNFTSTATMYNLTVDTTHTYYVLAGNIPVLVHNTCGPNAASSCGKIAEGLGYSVREIKDAIHAVKLKGMPRDGAQRNPDVVVDLKLVRCTSSCPTKVRAATQSAMFSTIYGSANEWRDMGASELANCEPKLDYPGD